MNIGCFLDDVAKQYPHKTCVLTGQTFPSWLGLTEQHRLS